MPHFSLESKKYNMKIIQVSNEKEYLLNVFESIKDDLLIIITKENKNIIVCDEHIFNEISEFLKVISINELNRKTRREIIEISKKTNSITLGRSDFIKSYN